MSAEAERWREIRRGGAPTLREAGDALAARDDAREEAIRKVRALLRDGASFGLTTDDCLTALEHLERKP